MELPQSLKDSVESTLVEYRQLGKSGLRVSVPILGAMSIGSRKWQDWVLDEEKALPLLKEAYDKGLNTWDTANIYSNGVSEALIGKAIKHYQIPRQKLVIMTKCFGAVADDPGMPTILFKDAISKSKDYVNQFGLSRQAIFHAVDASLKRLQTDYIDLLQIHRFDKSIPIEETMEALHDLVKSGKVRYIGASSMLTYQFVMMQHVAEKRGWTKFVSMQNQYNLLYREEEREMNKYCNETGVGLIPWSPLCRGHLARPPSTASDSIRATGEMGKPWAQTGYGETDRQIIGRVHELAQKKGWPMSHVALSWINKRVTSPIIGFSSLARMEDAVQARGKTLTDEEEHFLEELYQPKALAL